MQAGSQDKIEYIPENLTQAIDGIYLSNKLVINDLVCSLEGKKYGACSFTLNSKVVVFRVARITPKKIGQFVTFWKRAENGLIRPYDLTDPADLFVISVQKKEFCGQFIFPKALLFEKGIVSKEGIGGKRAFRVYPPWDNPVSQQGRKTQIWQLEYFLDFSIGVQPNRKEVKKLYGIAL